MLSGDLPPAYLVYTTGNGFAPSIEGIPHAMKGLATVFMLALLTGKRKVDIGNISYEKSAYY